MNKWQTYKIKDLTQSFSGGTPLTDRPEFYQNGDIPFITSSDLNQQFIDSVPHYITKQGLESSSAKIVEPQTLLLALYGATAGTAAITHIRGTINQAILAFSKSKIDIKFLYYLLCEKKPYILHTYTQGGQPNLSAQIVNNLSIYIPTYCHEQQKIVEVLETWDKAIQLTRKLIEQKELQKKYLMQQLLTGRTRLKGFSNKWGNYKLQELAKIHKGKQLNSTELTATGEYPCLNGGITPSGYTHNWNSEKNTISISEGGNSCGYVNWNPKRFWAGGHCYTLSELKANPEFLYFLLKYKEKYIMSLRVGSGLPNIQRNSLENLILYVPNNREEQSRIGRLLVGVDLGGELLQKRLAQLEEQKKGLMQVLLTGKIRLK